MKVWLFYSNVTSCMFWHTLSGRQKLFLEKLLVRSCINLPRSSIKVSNKELFTSSDLPHDGILFDLQSGPLHAVIGEVL